jgi:hypothetical protein
MTKPKLDNLETRIERWKEDFELIYALSRLDAMEALEDCRTIYDCRTRMEERERISKGFSINETI